MSNPKEWFYTVKNVDGSVSMDFYKFISKDQAANLNEGLDLFIARGKELERERIIKLIEQEDKYYEHGQFNRRFLIALIKGDSK